MRTKKLWEKGFSKRRIWISVVGLCSLGLILDVMAPVPSCMAMEIYPSARITWVVPYKPGGGYDLLARAIGRYVTRYLREASPGARGGEIVIKNEAGASGQRAYNMVYNARPDGHTIGGFDISFATETLTTKLDFDLRNFNYLLRVNTTTRILVGNKSGYATWDGMIRASKTREIKWGVGAFGRAQHIAAILLREKLGLSARLIPFGGTAESMNALLRGDVHVSLVSEDSTKPLIDAKEVIVLADFTGISGYSGVPTLKDLGQPDLAEVIQGHRFVIAPPGLPKEISAMLLAAFKKATADQEFQAWAKKADIPLHLVFGDEADQMAKRTIRLYQEDLKAVLVKSLN